MAAESTTIDDQAPVGPGLAVSLLVGAQILGLVWAVLWLVIVSGGDIPDPLPIWMLVGGNLGLWVGYGLGPVLVAKLRRQDPVELLGARIEPSDVPLGLGLGVVLQVALLPLLYVPIGWFTDADPGESARALIDGVDGPVEAALLAFSAAVMAPLVEELFFRGLLLRALTSRFGAALGVAGSSLVFALVHQELILVPGLFVFAVVAAVLTLRTGRLGPAWTFHLGFNASTLILLGFF